MAKTAALALIRHRGSDLLIEVCGLAGMIWVVTGDFRLASLDMSDAELGQVVEEALSGQIRVDADPGMDVLEARQTEAAHLLGYKHLRAMLQAGEVAISLLDDGSLKARTFQLPGRARRPRLVGQTLELARVESPDALGAFARSALRRIAGSGA